MYVQVTIWSLEQSKPSCARKKKKKKKKKNEDRKKLTMEKTAITFKLLCVMYMQVMVWSKANRGPFDPGCPTMAFGRKSTLLCRMVACVYVCACVCVCVWVWVRAYAGGWVGAWLCKLGGGVKMCMFLCAFVCVCVCVWCWYLG